ncbi:MAG: hypothetical protein ETSY1_38090 [Candidatus Entotheonella factor]|uniref:Phospholipase/carboxylesterase/thioesterase domain-containing protein n=1 Tax=Entotheonella factor TaxID=1429438 RepID=W4L6M1_ENTF1|nr:PHB depolymerase family esterase [Candidatus Entotheonella palauensis]ETW93692.1 MAG: hypothetical protein ETSY1_38090 [Candidatus Entotheonella factor]
MAMPDGQYDHQIESATDHILRFLRTFESIQEHMDFSRFAGAQAQLQDAVGDVLPLLPSELDQLTPPAPMQAFHMSFTKAVTHCARAYEQFLDTQDRDLLAAFMYSRREFCLGLNGLYDLRAHLPALQPYWVLPDALPEMDRLETRVDGVDVPVGIVHHTEASGNYALYVPESYSADKPWPLVICLHGASGSGDDYIWTWLRPAKSKGYMVLSPKSADITWSILNLPRDSNAIMAMLDSVCETYVIDHNRIYLTGLSDGGTFAYLWGLSQPETFAGVAPVAGDMLNSMADGLLRRKQGINLPLFIVHGAQDTIFSVQSTRSAHQLLTHLGYNATYTELPDWGHAYTYSINEQLVVPWLESLTPRNP